MRRWRPLTMRLRAAAALLAAVLTWQSPALSADPVAQARTYYDAGVRAYAAAQYAVAIDAFTEAYRLAPRETILFSLAQAERRQFTLGRDPKHLYDALAHFRKYLNDVPEGGRRADAVEALGELEAIAARLSTAPEDIAGEALGATKARAKVMITVLTKDATVVLDGKEHKEGEGTVIEEVEPGPHTLLVTAKGHVEDRREIRAVVGTLVLVEVTLREQPSFLRLSAPVGARVLLDGQPVGEAPLRRDLEVSSGSHLLTVMQTGHVPYQRSITVERGRVEPVLVSLPMTGQRLAAFGVLGTAAAAAVVSAILAGGAAQAEAESQRVLAIAAGENLTRAQLEGYNASLALRDDLRTAALVALGMAGALGLGGAGLYLFDDRKVSFAASPAGVSIGLTGAF
jgi:hypothetical protein